MSSDNVIYFDNSATSWPKPRETGEAMMYYLNDVGANPGRSGHSRSVEAGQIVLNDRENLCRLFNVKLPQQIAFTKNITESLNGVFYKMIKGGDHVITSSMEHNSVMRPLRHLEKTGVIELTVVKADCEGYCDPDDFGKAVKPNTRMVVSTHSSNVTGTIQDIAAISRAVKAKKDDIIMVVDSAQSAGAIPIDVPAMGIDVLCFTGHKSLLGPTGTGGVYLNPAITPEPFMRGGTGSLSDLEEHPLFMPDVWEAGTGNPMGIAGLGAGVGFVLNKGVENIAREETALNQYFMDAIKDHDMVKIYGPMDAKRKTAVTSININGMVCSTVGEQLNDACGIMVRTGLHCAPGAHRTLGTFPEGTVRFSFGNFSTKDQVDVAVQAILALADYAAENKED